MSRNNNYLPKQNFENNSSNFTQTVIEIDETFIQYYSELRVAENERALERELAEKYNLKIVTL